MPGSVACAVRGEPEHALAAEDLRHRSDAPHGGRWPFGRESGGAGDPGVPGDGTGGPAVRGRGYDRRRDEAAGRLQDHGRLVTAREPELEDLVCGLARPRVE